MPSDLLTTLSPTKPKGPGTALSQYEYYQHDVNETLDSMTLQPSCANLECPTMRSVSTPSVVATPPMSSSSSTTFPRSSISASRTVSRDGQGSPPPSHHRHHHHQSRSNMTLMSGDGGVNSSRIPRRVKSSISAVGGGGSEVGGRMSGKRSTAGGYTALSSASSVVSTCLLANSHLGGGDGVSLDPEVDMWLEMVPLSKRPFKNFHRDFADGVLVAEIMAHFFPKKVDLHNYVPASATSNKKANWHTLNQKVFSKMGIRFADSLIEGISLAKPGCIEKALRQVHRLIDNMDRKQMEIRSLELSTLAASFNGSSLEAPFVEEPCLVRNMPGEIPDCVIYQNIKYYPSTAFDEITKIEEQLTQKNNELCNKVRRLETLLSLKESHLQDLTSKIHEIRAKQPQEITSQFTDFRSGGSGEANVQ